MQHEKIEEILYFWFGPVASADLPDEHRTRLWFSADPSIDETITLEYGDLLESAPKQHLAPWQDSARGALASIILLDQFSRHVYRGKAKAFEQDALARQYCYQALEKGHEQQLSLIERVFFFMPLEHSENSEDQIRSVAAYKHLMKIALEETRSMFNVYYEYAIEHYRVIEQFGRFPHRNELLNRSSTPEEEAYLWQLEHQEQ